jgi:hypothetical protein
LGISQNTQWGKPLYPTISLSLLQRLATPKCCQKNWQKIIFLKKKVQKRGKQAENQGGFKNNQNYRQHFRRDNHLIRAETWLFA